MNLMFKKNGIVIYGLFRMIIGIAQIVGLSAGYFLTEFIVRYPNKSSVFIIDQDLIVLIYLTVFIRGAFHLTAGIGIAMLKEWGRKFLKFGWPAVLCVNLCLTLFLYQDWNREGFVHSYWQIMAWPKIFLYFSIIFLDYFVINKFIEEVNKDRERLDESGGRIEILKIRMIFITSVIFFILLIFLGKPIKQGFHKGFYKSRGEIRVSGEQIGISKGKDQVSKGIAKPKGIENQGEQKSSVESISKPKSSLVFIDDSKKSKEFAKDSKGVKKLHLEGGLSYSQMIGFLGGFCFILALLLKIFGTIKPQDNNKVAFSENCLFGFGFMSWMIYGIIYKIYPIMICSFIASTLCIAVVIMQSKKTGY